jgi:hypothetical protein
MFRREYSRGEIDRLETASAEGRVLRTASLDPPVERIAQDETFLTKRKIRPTGQHSAANFFASGMVIGNPIGSNGSYLLASTDDTSSA